MTQPKFFAAFGKTDYFKSARGRLGFWDFFGRGIKPYGYLFSLAYKQAIFPEPDVPIFGDCGAPKYRYEDSPTIGNQSVTASWAADEYRSRTVHHREKYIVAPDHILMEGLSHKQLEQRREFNWTQARDFLSLVKDWPNTTAIAVAHGVTFRERIHATRCLIELGYEAIGLGGLVGIGGVRYTLEVIRLDKDLLPMAGEFLTCDTQTLSTLEVKEVTRTAIQIQREVLNLTLKFPTIHRTEAPVANLGMILQSLQYLINAIGQIKTALPYLVC